MPKEVAVKEQTGPPRLIVGQCYYVRTLTDHWVGRLAEIGPHTVTLTEASWVADSGRLSVFIATGRADGMEIEPVGIVGGLNYLSWIPWKFKLFMEAI
jgi:hypothetical protein